MVIALCWLIPSPRRPVDRQGGLQSAPDLALVQEVVPAAHAINEFQDADGFWNVDDRSGQAIARVGRTLPDAIDIIGYRGPTEAMVVIDQAFNVLGVRMIESDDTDEHVQKVQDDRAFFEQFANWDWEGPNDAGAIDGVSGATLTSLALAKGVLSRIGGERGSLVFPDPIELVELEDWFPDADRIEDAGHQINVLGPDGRQLGRVIRTGPLVESVVGYQGPSELLLWLSEPTQSDEASTQVKAIKIRSSFDNQPYVRYCRMERSFWKKFTDKSMQSLAGMTLESSGVEGVSGATMTSLAMTETIYQSSSKWLAQQEAARQQKLQRSTLKGRFTEWFGDVRFGLSDLGCFLLLAALAVAKRMRWFGNKSLRRLWLVTTITVLGFWTGNLISMSLIAGWGAEGVAWRLAPALATIAMVACVVPATGKSNPYCNHLCPHGAIQQLVRPARKSRMHQTLPKNLSRLMQWIPGATLVIAYLCLLFWPTVELANWEPFHAYLWRVTPLAAILFAAATLVLSMFIPMAYCRLGCPTGRLLDFLRQRATSHRLTFADVVASLLLVTAIGVQMFSIH